MSEFDVNRVAIIGVGLLGGSVGLGLRESGFAGEIVGVGRTRSTLETARERGCIDRAETDLATGIAGADLIVLATPVGTILRQLDELAAAGIGDAVVTDVGSTKSAIVAAAERALGEAAGRFCGSHPMAGKTESGPEAADGALFRGRPCIVTPTGRTEPDARRRVEQLWTMLGATLLTMSPADHDFQTAVVSHLPHLAAVLLVDTAIGAGGWDVASTGFESTTRLASSNPPMRVDIARDNREPILRAIELYRQRLDRLTAALTDDDAAALGELFERCKDARDRWLDSR